MARRLPSAYPVPVAIRIETKRVTSAMACIVADKEPAMTLAASPLATFARQIAWFCAASFPLMFSGGGYKKMDLGSEKLFRE